MATELAKAYVQIIPSAKGIKGKISEELGGEASSAGSSAGTSIASAIKKAIVVAGIGAALKASLEEGGNLQQSIGGIETLFKDSADKVIESAKIAYKTAGMSANEYMETVTSFSASLLQGLAGDTNKAADVADMALTDMSDNANKMGTSMELIQNAYNGFAKQNYTMLDNLKLGYGGTKTEMQRLLADAQKLTGVKYDIDNLSDVYEAIHVIQEEMGITGTTAKEAASTLSGSMASMKAAFTNVLGNLSLGEDIGPSLQALGGTVFTFMKGNLIPMVGNVLSGLPELIESGMSMAIQGLNLVAANADTIVQTGIDLLSQLVVGIVSAIPYLKEAALNIVMELGSAIVHTDWIEVATGILTQLRDNLELAAMEILGTGGNVVNALFNGILTQLPVISAGITDAFQMVWDACNTIWAAVGQPVLDYIITVFQYVSDNWGSISEMLSDKFQALWGMCGNIWETVGQPLWDGIISAVHWLSENWTAIAADIFQMFQDLWSTCQNVWAAYGQPVWDMISFAVSELWDLFKTHMPAIMEFFREAIAGIKDTWDKHLKPVFEAIGYFLNDILKPTFEFVFKTVIEPLVTNVFDAIRKLWNGTLKPVFDGVCDFLRGVFTNDWKSAFQGILNIVTGIFNAIVVAIQQPMKLVQDIVESAINFIKEKFDFDWKLPELKMPHFTISGSFSLSPPSVPSFGIEWYAKAMNEPMILNSPTAFGINSLGQLRAGGEAGSEVVSGTDTLMQMIATAVAEQNQALLAVLYKILEAISAMDANMGGNLAEALEGIGININNREFARLVREVTV